MSTFPKPVVAGLAVSFVITVAILAVVFDITTVKTAVTVAALVGWFIFAYFIRSLIPNWREQSQSKVEYLQKTGRAAVIIGRLFLATGSLGLLWGLLAHVDGLYSLIPGLVTIFLGICLLFAAKEYVRSAARLREQESKSELMNKPVE
jgi:hypothetical protein